MGKQPTRLQGLMLTLSAARCSGVSSGSSVSGCSSPA